MYFSNDTMKRLNNNKLGKSVGKRVIIGGIKTAFSKRSLTLDLIYMIRLKTIALNNNKGRKIYSL